jgi:hypothetical protein
MKKNILLFSMLVVSVWSYSQQIIWTGHAGNNDFFDENNWQDNTTNSPPASGSIDVNQAINLDLQLLNTSALFNDNLAQIQVNGVASSYQSNLRLDNYYENGTVIRSYDLSTSPLTIYDGSNLQGRSANLSINIIHNGLAIPNTINNKAESFLLKKGFMATFVIVEDSTRKNKNYIASVEDLIINKLPSYLLNNISFIRVMPWNWITKKERSGKPITHHLNNDPEEIEGLALSMLDKVTELATILESSRTKSEVFNFKT